MESESGVPLRRRSLRLRPPLARLIWKRNGRKDPRRASAEPHPSGTPPSIAPSLHCHVVAVPQGTPSVHRLRTVRHNGCHREGLPKIPKRRPSKLSNVEQTTDRPSSFQDSPSTHSPDVSSRARASCVRGEGERERESFRISKRRHYGRRTTSEGKRKPLTVPHGAPQAQDVADRRPHQKHRRRARDAEHRAQQCHLGVPFGGAAGWHRLGR